MVGNFVAKNPLLVLVRMQSEICNRSHACFVFLLALVMWGNLPSWLVGNQNLAKRLKKPCKNTRFSNSYLCTFLICCVIHKVLLSVGHFVWQTWHNWCADQIVGVICGHCRTSAVCGWLSTIGKYSKTVDWCTESFSSSSQAVFIEKRSRSSRHFRSGCTSGSCSDIKRLVKPAAKTDYSLLYCWSMATPSRTVAVELYRCGETVVFPILF